MKVNLNEYVLTAGLLLFIMSLAHAIYGEAVVFSDLRFLTFDRALFAAVYMPWHQMSLVLLICAIGLIYSSFKHEHRSIQAFVLFVVLSNVVVFASTLIAGSSLHEKSASNLIFQAWPEFVFLIILVLLIALGLRKNAKVHE